MYLHLRTNGYFIEVLGKCVFVLFSDTTTFFIIIIIEIYCYTKETLLFQLSLLSCGILLYAQVLSVLHIYPGHDVKLHPH